MKQDELNKILNSHEAWLNKKQEGQCADLRGADLQHADLEGADLRGADLQRADLEGADLQNTGLLMFRGEKDRAIYTPDGTLNIGCYRKHINIWVEEYKKIGEEHSYTNQQIQVYKQFIDLCKKQYDRIKGEKNEII